MNFFPAKTVTFGGKTYEVLLSKDCFADQHRVAVAAPGYHRELQAGTMNWRRAVRLALKQR